MREGAYERKRGETRERDSAKAKARGRDSKRRECVRMYFHHFAVRVYLRERRCVHGCCCVSATHRKPRHVCTCAVVCL